MDGNKIGTRIKALRDERGKTQADVAAALFVKRQTVDQWENNQTRDLKTQYTVALADYFGVTCDWILRGVKSENVRMSKEVGLSDKAIDRLANFTVITTTKEEGIIEYSVKTVPAPIEISELIEQDEFVDLINWIKSMKQVKEGNVTNEVAQKLQEILGDRELWEYYRQSAMKSIETAICTIAPIP